MRQDAAATDGANLRLSDGAASIRSFQKESRSRSLAASMAATPPPRPWYRSPALWFFLPGLVFLVWGWVFSMQRQTNLDFEIWGHSGRLQNDGSTIGANWMERPAPGLAPTPPKEFHFEVIPRPYWASTDWFPLPSYLVTSGYPKPWHYIDIPHWFLLLVYVGLWQLPWLARYHRRRRIERSLAIA
jgi:hypothetical protein